MMTAASFPRFSLSGTLILAAYLSSAKVAFDMSFYSDSLLSGKFATSSSISLNGVIMATSLLNSISHGAVVLGALHDTYVMSILVGVGFDVVTRILYLVWWVQLSVIAFNEQHEIMDQDNATKEYALTIFLLVVLSIVYVYQIVIHIQALQMNQSYDRLIKVLRSALNNLRGVVGQGYGDHLFAYSDLGGHLAPFYLSFYLLNQQQALLSGLWIFVLLVVASGLVLSRVPLNINNAKYKSNQSFVRINGGNIECSCQACKKRVQSTGRYASFTFTRRDGVCCLWLYSFEELSNILLGMSDMKLSKNR